MKPYSYGRDTSNLLTITTQTTYGDNTVLYSLCSRNVHSWV